MPYSVRFRALKVNPVRVDLAAIESGVRTFMTAHMESVIKEIRKYPPEPPKSTYVRTFKLYDSWDIVGPTRTALGFEASIINFASDRKSGRRYMRYVQGRWQTDLHMGTGWLRVDEAAHRRNAEYRAGLQRIYNSAIKQGA